MATPSSNMHEPKAAPPDGGGRAPADAPDGSGAYWAENVKLLCSLLAVWFVVSFGAGILFVGPLNAITVGGFPLGFWFAQQGAIYVFVALIFFYAHRMKKIERRYGVNDDA